MEFCCSGKHTRDACQARGIVFNFIIQVGHLLGKDNCLSQKTWTYYM